MKKLLFSMVVATLMTACATPVINQTELYGTVESVIYLNGYYHAKTWCKAKWMYYDVVADKAYRIGETIRIK